MRTATILLEGIFLLLFCLGVAKLTAGASPSSITLATAAFVAIWFVAAAVNLRMGLRAGYSFQEELPIFLLIFLLPVAVAVFMKWKFS